MKPRSHRHTAVMDGNTAVAHVAYRVNEVCAIYPITPSSTMAELADEWASGGLRNIWGDVPLVHQMQSEAGAAGTVHGALQSGALTTTFTASQGLLLMMPNMFKIAGELTPTVFHVAARAVATQALSIFGDHSDVMAVRSTGFAMLASSSVQEAHDLALVAQAATLESRIPFLHFFDGFRTSHEVNKLTLLADDEIRALIHDDLVRAHRARALTPDRPVVRGTAHNPDTFFQAREAASPFYARTPLAVERAMAAFAEVTGRVYRLFEYDGPEDAERVIVLIGSGAETARVTAEWLRSAVGGAQKVGVLQVRLYRPFSAAHFLAALPATVRSIAVLDRTKEPGGAGEPLYLDVVTTLARAVATGERAAMPRVVGGRYGLASKDFTPAMVKAVFDELARPEPRNGFTVGILDDVSGTSLDYDPDFDIEPDDVVRAVFYGLGADGTVGANKNSVKILAEDEGRYAQGYFVYDSHKSGAQTVSHLRFGPRPIRAPYLIGRASFVACHQFGFLDRIDVLTLAEPGATLLLNCPHPAEEAWDRLPRSLQQGILDKGLRLFVIDATRVARETGLGGLVNTVLQTCFFAISGVLPREAAVERIKHAIEKSYGRKGRQIVAQNFAAVDATLAALREVAVPSRATSRFDRQPTVPATAPEFVRRFTAVVLAGRGDSLPVSAMPVDGTFPTGTTAWEKRNIADEVPVWEPDLCIQCGQCSIACPHSVIRARFYDAVRLAGPVEPPPTFKSAPVNARGFPDSRFTLQFYVDDCTGCGLCVEVCPAHSPREPDTRAINMAPKTPLIEAERANIGFFEDAAGQRPGAGRLRQCPRHPVPRALVRVLGRLCRLRRDALSAAPLAAVRRSAADRQRHRLLLDLRRQPAGHTLDHQRRGTRARLVELAVRGQCRVRPRLPAGGRHAHRPGGTAPARAGAPARRRSWSRPRWRPRRSASRRSWRSANGWPNCAGSCTRCRTSRAPRHCSRSSTIWSAAASGSWAATAGPTTSAMAGSTTSWPAAATSMCWCWTPRSTPTPAARPPRPRPWGWWPSSPPAASVPRARISPCRPSPTAMSTWPRSPWVRTRSRRSWLSARPKPGPGRR